jgi:two-component system nitrogen regulation response regulator NtrX
MTGQTSIVIVDDEQSILQSLGGILEDEGYRVGTALSGEEALKLCEDTEPDLVFLDIWLPGMDGIEVLERLREINPLTPVIMISGHGTIETAVKATRLGAFDFLEKPLSLDKVLVTVTNALRYGQLARENLILREKTSSSRRIIGGSSNIRKLKEQIEIVAPTQANVLITGGKRYG